MNNLKNPISIQPSNTRTLKNTLMYMLIVQVVIMTLIVMMSLSFKSEDMLYDQKETNEFMATNSYRKHK